MKKANQKKRVASGNTNNDATSSTTVATFKFKKPKTSTHTVWLVPQLQIDKDHFRSKLFNQLPEITTHILIVDMRPDARRWWHLQVDPDCHRVGDIFGSYADYTMAPPHAEHGVLPYKPPVKENRFFMDGNVAYTGFHLEDLYAMSKLKSLAMPISINPPKPWFASALEKVIAVYRSERPEVEDLQVIVIAPGAIDARCLQLVLCADKLWTTHNINYLLSKQLTAHRCDMVGYDECYKHQWYEGECEKHQLPEYARPASAALLVDFDKYICRCGDCRECNWAKGLPCGCCVELGECQWCMERHGGTEPKQPEMTVGYFVFPS